VPPLRVARAAEVATRARRHELEAGLQGYRRRPGIDKELIYEFDDGDDMADDDFFNKA
jgi:hypothetical protein